MAAADQIGSKRFDPPRGLEEGLTDAVREMVLRSPGGAWALSARSVASLFRFSASAPEVAAETLVVTGDRDTAIPAWATRFFVWWSGLPRYDLRILPGAGYLLFHDHLDVSVPLVAAWLDERLGARAAGGGDHAVGAPA